MSATQYYYRQNGRDFGPVTGAGLKDLAATGKLTGDDLVRRDGTEKWERASRVRGLFPSELPLSVEPPAEQRAEGVPPAPPAPERDAAAPATPDGSDAGSSSSREPGWASKVRPIANRYAEAVEPFARRQAEEFGLGYLQFLACVAGAVCLLLLALSTLLTWETLRVDAMGMTNSNSYRGLEILEGKAIALMSVAGIALFAATFFVKRLLPVSLLLAGAACTCSLILAFSYLQAIDRYNEDIAEATGQLSQNFETMFGEEQGEQVSDKVIPDETDSAGFGLYLSLLAGLASAPAFVFAALSKPLTLPFLQKDSVHPLARKQGALLISQGAALLVGAVGYILRF